MECPVKNNVDPLTTCPLSSPNEIDPDTKMPRNLSQSTMSEAALLLPTERSSSSIPRAGTETTWQYPSARMFYAALERKGKGVPTNSISAMLAIHNALNESVWEAIVAREQFLYKLKKFRGPWFKNISTVNNPDHGNDSVVSSTRWTPKLKRFSGRPEDWSPRAWWHVRIRGGQPPFDRHDWIVEREGGETVRYVIDYYEAPSEEAGEATFNVDIRPAIDNPRNIIDRIKLYWAGFK